MHGYLLDTNILAFWFSESYKDKHDRVMQHIGSLPEGTPFRVSTITLGEIEYGHRAHRQVDTPIQAEFNQFVEEQVPEVLDVRKTTRVYYGPLRARLFEKFAPKNLRKQIRLAQLIDPVTDKSLGIQENDLWIAAQAIEYNLVLVTHDRMQHLRDVAGDLMVEDWAV